MANDFPTITKEAVDQLRAKIGEKRPAADPFNEFAGKDAIRHFVHGIGDTNPLFIDEDYAKKTRYGRIIAPPCFLFSMIGWNYPRGLPGIHGMWSGAEFECFLPINVNDRISAVLYLSKVEERFGRFAGRTVLQEWTHDFTNQDNKCVAVLKQWSMRTERDAARRKQKLKKINLHHYTEKEIQNWDNDFARKVGVPAAYDFGPQRCSWMGQLITNWMGDDGFIKNLRAELRGFNLIGDTNWCRGKVVDKHIDGDQFLVRCELWAENQRNERIAKGEATVLLPSKENAVWPADSFKN